MNVRSQVSMVFHLDKCIGCHTCVIACKNIWTDRKGTEYMWWNNVETKPGTGYPTLWEDQEKYKGGWELKDDELAAEVDEQASRPVQHLPQPDLPTIDDYYEPWTYDYEHCSSAPGRRSADGAPDLDGHRQATSNIEAGPNWDDDLGGSPIYAANDPNLQAMTPEQREQLFAS